MTSKQKNQRLKLSQQIESEDEDILEINIERSDEWMEEADELDEENEEIEGLIKQKGVRNRKKIKPNEPEGNKRRRGLQKQKITNVEKTCSASCAASAEIIETMQKVQNQLLLRIEQMQKYVSIKFNNVGEYLAKINQTILENAQPLRANANRAKIEVPNPLLENSYLHAFLERKRNSVPISLEKMKEVIVLANLTSNTRAAKTVKVSEATIRRWRKILECGYPERECTNQGPRENTNGDDPNNINQNSQGYGVKKSKRVNTKKESLRAFKILRMEETLRNFINERRQKFLPVTMLMITKKALEIMRSLYPEEPFKASNGWFQRFTSRSNLSSRLANSKLNSGTKNFVELIKNYLQEIKE